LLNSQQKIENPALCRANETHAAMYYRSDGIVSYLMGSNSLQNRFERRIKRWGSARVAAFEVDAKVVKKFASILVLYSRAELRLVGLSADERGSQGPNPPRHRWNYQRATSSPTRRSWKN